MAAHHHVARKRFGQHFLCDGGIIDAIVHAIAPEPGDAMVEIGPGLAALTQPLVQVMRPEGQVHTPLTQVAPELQTWPQAPQLFVSTSVCVSQPSSRRSLLQSL